MPRTLINLILDWGLDPGAGTRRVSVEVDHAVVGEGYGTQPNTFHGLYHWTFMSSLPDSVASFELKARGQQPPDSHSYDVFSGTPQVSLGQLTDHSVQMFSGSSVSGECSAGHFEIKEPFLAQVKDGLNLGRSRTFQLAGHPQGEIRFNSSPGINDIDIDFESPFNANPEVRAVLVASVLLLYKGIEHYD